MSCHQEKIVSLAEELLRDRGLCRAETFQPTRRAKEKSYALKAACLNALLSVSEAALGAHFLHEMRRPINKYERFEIDALIFYTAKREGKKQASLKGTIQKTLGLASLEDLCALDYRRIRDYLWTRLDG